MKQALLMAGLAFLAIDAAGLLLLLLWSLTAGTPLEAAFAIGYLLLLAAVVLVGGGILAIGAKRNSLMGLWLGTILLAGPPLLALAIRISNSL